METEHAETVVDKAVAFVKDMFGVHTQPSAGVADESEYHDTAPELTAESAMRLNPNAYATGSVGAAGAEPYTPAETGLAFERDLGGAPISAALPGELYGKHFPPEENELPQEKSALELNRESARREDGK